jgi:hypothetical protein
LFQNIFLNILKLKGDDELKSQLQAIKQIRRLESLKQSLAEREQIIKDRIKMIETPLCNGEIKQAKISVLVFPTI